MPSNQRILFALAIGFSFCLAGCQSPAEIAAEAAAREAEVTASDNRTCTGYGFTFGTPAFAECRMKVASDREANETARRIAQQQEDSTRRLISEAEAARRQVSYEECVRSSGGKSTYCFR